MKIAAKKKAPTDRLMFITKLSAFIPNLTVLFTPTI